MNTLTDQLNNLAFRAKNQTNLATKEFLEASKKGNLNIVKQYLNENKTNLGAINATDDQGNSALLLAAQNYQWGILETLLEIPGLNVNAADNEDKTTLHWAALNGHEPSVQLLINKGANALHKDKEGSTAEMAAKYFSIANLLKSTALMQTLQTRNLDAIKRFLEDNYDRSSVLNAMNTDGDTGLMWAARNGHLDIVLALLAIDDVDISLKNKNQTALDIARLQGHTAIVEALQRAEFFNAITKGELAFVDNYLKTNPGAFQFVNGKGQTALMIACLYGQKSIVDILLSKPSININARDNTGTTALMNAAYRGDLTIVQELLNKGADTEIRKNSQSNLDIFTTHPDVANLLRQESLFKAASTGNLILLHQRLAQVSANFTHQSGNTPLIIAARNGHLSIVQALINKGVDPYLQDRNQKTALDAALQGEHREIVTVLQKAFNEDLLKAAKSDNLDRVQLFVAESKKIRNVIKIVDEFGNTPLQLAVRNKNLAMVKALVTVDCHVNQRNRRNDTALNFAIILEQLDMVEALLTAPGIQINNSNRAGDNPFIYAVYTGNKEIVAALLKKGANPKLTDLSGKTGEQIARERGLNELADLLKKAEAQWDADNEMGSFLNEEVANKVSPLSIAYPRDRDGDINPALKIFGTKQNQMDNGRWEIFVLLENEEHRVSMRSGVKSQTWDYNDLKVSEQFNFSLFPNPLTREITRRLQGYRHGHPTLALDFRKLDQGIYETLPVFSGGWLLRNDNENQKRIQVYWSSGRYSADRYFTAEEEHLIQLCTAYHLMKEYGEDFVVEMYPFSSTPMSDFITKKASGGKLYDWNNLVHEINQLMVIKGVRALELNSR